MQKILEVPFLDALYLSLEVALLVMATGGVVALICFASMVVDQHRIDKGGR